MTKVEDFYNNEFYNDLFVICIDDFLYSMKSFEKLTSNKITITKNNIFQYFIYLNHFSGRFKSKQYLDNLEMVNKEFFEKDYFFSSKGLTKNKQKLMQEYLTNYLLSPTLWEKEVDFIANSNQYINQEINSGIKFQEMLENHFKNNKEDEITLNNLINSYIERINYLGSTFHNIKTRLYSSKKYEDLDEYKEFWENVNL